MLLSNTFLNNFILLAYNRILFRGFIGQIKITMATALLKTNPHQWIMLMLLVSVLGVGVGLVLGLTGAGGGILAVPALVLGMHWSMTQAAPIALIAVGLAALTGAIDGLKKKLVRYKAAFLMAFIGSLAAPIGVHLAHILPEFFLMWLFSAIMILVAMRMIRPFFSAQIAHAGPAPARCQLCKQTGRFIWNQSTFSTISIIGAVSGLFTGMLGVGGGFLIVPALQRYTSLSMHSIVATSLMVIALISTSTVGLALWQTPTFPFGTWHFVGAVVIGMLIGRGASSYIPGQIIQLSFAFLCIVAAAIVAMKA